MNRILAIVIGLFALTAASTAQAFPHLYMWADPANGHPSQNLSPAPAIFTARAAPKIAASPVRCAMSKRPAPSR